MFKKVTSGIMILIGMILMPVINVAMDPDLEVKAFEETQNLTLADTVVWEELNNHTLSEVFEDGQLISNNKFMFDDDQNGLSNGYGMTNGKTPSIIDGKQRVYYNIITNTSGLYYVSTFNFIQNQKIWFKGGILTDNTVNSQRIYIIELFGSYTPKYFVASIYSLDYENVSNIVTITNTGNHQIYWNTASANNGSYIEIKPFNLINLTSLGIDTLTVSQMDYWYEKYLEYREIEAIITPPLTVDGCTPSVGCYTYIELGKLMFNDGLLAMIPREMNGVIYFPIFRNIIQFAKNGAVYLIEPTLGFLSEFVPFLDYETDEAYDDQYYDELTWSYMKYSQSLTEKHDVYYFDEVISTRKLWWFWNATEYKYIGYDVNDNVYRYFYNTVTFLGGNGTWTSSKTAISSYDMENYNRIYGWKE